MTEDAPNHKTEQAPKMDLGAQWSWTRQEDAIGRFPKIGTGPSEEQISVEMQPWIDAYKKDEVEFLRDMEASVGDEKKQADLRSAWTDTQDLYCTTFAKTMAHKYGLRSGAEILRGDTGLNQSGGRAIELLGYGERWHAPSLSVLDDKNNPWDPRHRQYKIRVTRAGKGEAPPIVTEETIGAASVFEVRVLNAFLRELER